MSCQFLPLAVIVDLENVQKSLFFHILGNSGSKQDVWDWEVDHSTTARKPEWLDECCVVLSPTGELLVITHKTNMVIFTSKWDSQEETMAKTKFYITWSGDPCQEPNEVITSAICLPIAASQTSRTAHCAPDWTCIALGFSSGAVRFYTETGSLLLSEVFHEGSVTSIKCQTFTPSRHVFAPELSDELHVTYRNVVCSVYGFVLTNTLKACRNQLARVQANCEDTITAPPLNVQKWSCPEQDNMVDCCVGLSQYPSSFSHLVTASVCGGFNAGYRPTPPQSSLVIAVGNKPFVGFHYAIEGSSAPILTDVAKAVATKLKSAIGQAVPGWLLGGRKPSPQQEKTKEKLTMEAADPMVCRFGLCDVWRQGSSISVSPHRNLSAVTDTLGRVTLVDNSSGKAVRMWKGYRDAQCGWITAEEEQHSSRERKRTALFLAIYAPKKAIIEVWALQQGPRLASFTATRHGKLLSVGYNLLGMSSLNNKGPNRSPLQCVFIDEEGNIKEITVPFHLALSDKNSNRARDIHLLKKIKAVLKEGDDENVDVAHQCQEMRTNEMRAYALDVLCASRTVSAQMLLEVVEGFIQALDVQNEKSDPENKALLQRCRHLQKLLIFYQFTLTCQQKPPDYDAVVADDSNNDVEKLSEFLFSTKEEIERMLMLVANGTERDTTRVKFQEKPEGLPAFLAAFNTNQNEDVIQLNHSTSTQNNLSYLSEVIFQGSLSNISAWEEAASESTISPSVLMALSLVYWLNRTTVPTIPEIYSFTHLLRSICTIAGSQLEDRIWWEDVRTQIHESPSPLPAITATLVCRAVSISFEETIVMTESMETDNEGEGIKPNDWEKVTEDSCLWGLLLSQLEDVSIVYSTLRRRPVATTNSMLHCLDYEVPQLSLSSVLAKGKGCISELVAKWLVSSGISPILLLDDDKTEVKTVEVSKSRSISVGIEEGLVMETDTGTEARAMNQQEADILDHLSKLRIHFPYSLTASILVANMCWEYVIAWSHQVDLLNNLQSALTCLSAIPNPHLKQGICTMLWSMHLKVRFETSVRLINRVGKVAKERLCRQDVGLSDTQMTDFFKICSDFLDIFMESNVLSEMSSKPIFRSEEFWDNSTVPPLHQLAVGQATANYDVLHLLSQCCRALYFLATFNLKTQRPLNAFFDSVGQNALFSEVNSANVQLPGHFVNSRLNETRMNFLLRAVTGAMSTVIKHNMEYNTKQAVDWMSQCLALAADWSIQADPLRRQQVCELYARGFDRLAEEIIPAVNEKSLLGSQLLVIAGRRMKRLLTSSNIEFRERVTHLSPVLTTWINSLTNGTEEEVQLAETSQLAVTALSLMEPYHEDLRIAGLLVHSLQPFSAAASVSDASEEKSLFRKNFLNLDRRTQF